ncbi:hypothetical protein ACIBSV_11195 [Embleya sp. NPDC050154]|uniref:hypothetical protein n=1 Tax=Embleya sp. NPDC050154 TaxID=3363988 RepID=UPI003788DA33
MRITTSSFELWQRPRLDDLPAPLVGVGFLVVAVLARGDTATVAGCGAVGVLLLALGVWRFVQGRRRPLLRLDAVGVTLGPEGRERRGWGRAVPWGDIDAVVCWKAGKGRDAYWVGIAASPAFRARHGLDKMRVNRFLDQAVGMHMPVMGTVTRWQGSEAELHRLRDTVARVAPETPFVDPHDEAAAREASA